MNVEVAVFGSAYGVCERKATFEEVFSTCEAREGVGLDASLESGAASKPVLIRSNISPHGFSAP